MLQANDTLWHPGKKWLLTENIELFVQIINSQLTTPRVGLLRANVNKLWQKRIILNKLLNVVKTSQLAEGSPVGQIQFSPIF